MLDVRIVLTVMAHDRVMVLDKLNFVVDWCCLGRLNDIDDFLMVIAII